MTTDPLDVLERIHRDVKLLGQLAGPALEVRIEAVKPPVTPRSRASAVEFAERVARYLEERGRSRQAQIATDLQAKRERVTDALKRLAAEQPPRAHRAGAERARGQTLGRLSPCWAPGPPPEDKAPPAEPDPPAPPPEPVPEPAAPPPPPQPLALAPPLSAGRAPTPPKGRYGGSPTAKQVAAFQEAQAEWRRRRSFEAPPASPVLDLLCDQPATSREVAAALGMSQVAVEQEIHELKPWLERMHDGYWRAIERLRDRASAA